MCVVSMITDHYRTRFPIPDLMPWPTWEEYLELRRKAALYDEMTGQKDCVDLEKEKWHEEAEKVKTNDPIKAV